MQTPGEYIGKLKTYYHSLIFSVNLQRSGAKQMVLPQF